MEQNVNDYEELGKCGSRGIISLNTTKGTSLVMHLGVDDDFEMEKKKIHDEYNVQRAKMKELFLQKEAECAKLNAHINALNREVSEMKSQLYILKLSNESELMKQRSRAQEEVTSLQQLVQETIEELALCKNELEKLKSENSEFKGLASIHQQEAPTFAPVLNHVRKTLARKLGADPSICDNLDDSMRKVNKYAQEDAEVLRSLVVPLEEEIKALKEKLRRADEELQTYHTTHVAVSPTTNATQLAKCETLQKEERTEYSKINKFKQASNFLECAMCKNYEMKLVQSQKKIVDSEDFKCCLQKKLDDAHGMLKKEAALRRNLEEQWQEKREEHKKHAQNLAEQVKKSEIGLLKLQKQFLETKNIINSQLCQVATERQCINTRLERLQKDNEFLSGKYLQTSDDLINQKIDLPSDVAELHELLLKQHDELIRARVGYEYEMRKSLSYMDEAQILRVKLENVSLVKEERDKKHQSQINSLEDRLKTILLSQQNIDAIKEEQEKREMCLNKQLSELRVLNMELRTANETLEKANGELRGRVKILQDELATSEQVQKDFVKLSQSLQMNLEKIRQAETEVRWQDDDDVDKCPTCNISFTVTIRKQHCRHCGVIYCDKCLTKSVPSGLRKKLARVCDICHTLLVPHTAPYFSRAPPQSPM